MERGDGFWTQNKGWKTRREQQDAYRKALDKQIEERKKTDHKRHQKTSSPVIADPVQHLMPWLNDSANSAPSENKLNMSAPSPQQQQYPMMQYISGGSSQNQAAAPTNYYYVANPLPPPQLQGQKIQTGPFEFPQPDIIHPFYAPAPIPPPPAFVNGPYSAYGNYTPQAQVLSTGYSHQPAVPQYQIPVPPPPEVNNQHQNAFKQQQRQDQSESGHATKSEQIADIDAKQTQHKIHVSQTSEEVASHTISKEDYRHELAKQVEERKRKEEELAKLEKEEDEKIQKKIREEQEMMQREAEEERRKTEILEQEKRKAAFEKIKTLEKSQQQIEYAKRAEEERMIQDHRERRMKMQENSAKNKNTDTSPSRYYHRELPPPQSPSWAWESTPIPAAGDKRSYVPMSGSGDAPEQQFFSARKSRHDSKSGVQSVESTARSALSFADCEDYPDHDSCRSTQPNSASSTKTYSVSFDYANNPSGCKSVENASNPSLSCQAASEASTDTEWKSSDETMTCPKCTTSFSVSDLKIPQSPLKRLEFVKSLERLQEKLKAEKETLVENKYEMEKFSNNANTGFQWKQQR